MSTKSLKILFFVVWNLECLILTIMAKPGEDLGVISEFGDSSADYKVEAVSENSGGRVMIGTLKTAGKRKDPALAISLFDDLGNLENEWEPDVLNTNQLLLKRICTLALGEGHFAVIVSDTSEVMHFKNWASSCTCFYTFFIPCAVSSGGGNDSFS